MMVFRKCHDQKEEFKENIYKCKQIPGGNLLRLTGMKFNFFM